MHKNVILFALIAAFIITGGALVYKSTRNDAPLDNINPATETLIQDFSLPSEPLQAPIAPLSEIEPGSIEPAKAPVQAEQTQSESISISITKSTYNAGNLSLGGIVSGVQEAVCTFTVSDGTNNTDKSTDTINSNGTIGCALTIDASELDANTDWLVTASVTSASEQSASSTKTISTTDRSQ